MRRALFSAFALVVTIAAPAAAQPSRPVSAAAEAPHADVHAALRAFLDAWAAGDEVRVAAVLDPEVRMYGSDVAEVQEGPEAVLALLRLDQRLWGGAARIGELRNVSVAGGGEFVSVFFDAPFTVGTRPPMIVRFATTWRRTPQGLRLMQSANVVPTTGQSAAALLGGR